MEIYVSTDVEADGPIPGPNSMYSFGSSAFDATGKSYGTFYATLNELAGAAPDPKTKSEFWDKHQEAFAAARKGARDPAVVMKEYHEWVSKLPGKPVFVGFPVTYDFMWIYFYLMNFVGDSPFSHSGLDIKTYAACMLKKPYRESTKRNLPRAWFGKQPHTHQALDDAIGQGEMFLNMMNERNGKRRP